MVARAMFALAYLAGESTRFKPGVEMTWGWAMPGI